MHKITFFVCLVLFPALLFAGQFTIYEAGYPQIRDTNVRVEQVEDVIFLRGAYIEHNITLSFAYDFKSWFFKNYNELELAWDFQLPEEAIFHELLFWQGDSLVQAQIMDRWTAELLFNETTSPFREPALLNRGAPDWNGQVAYNLRVFPIKRNESQKVMIQYLLPVRPTSGMVRTWLPIEQITMTNGGADSLHLVFKYDQNSTAPFLIGKEDYAFTQNEADSLWQMSLPVRAGEFIELVLPSPIINDFFMTTYSDSTGNYYQLAINPPPLPAIHTPRKLLVLVDYSQVNTTGMTGNFLLSSLKETMGRALTAEDSIDLIVAYQEIMVGKPTWCACTAENLDTLFVACSGQQFLRFNTSQELLAAGADFLDRNGTGEVVWLTNRNDFPTDENGAKMYSDEVKSHFPPGTVFHILDLENVGSLRYVTNYGYMSQSFPFLWELTSSTGGNLFFLRFHSLKTAFAALFFEKVSHFEEIEVQTRVQNGFTYSKQLFSLFRGYYPLDFPVFQTGKYIGDFPMEVTVFGRTVDQEVRQDWTIQAGDVVPGSTQITTAWYGHHLQELAHESQSNWLINGMIDLSIQSRVLTAYTAFLVPNPDAIEYYKETNIYSDNSTEAGRNEDSWTAVPVVESNESDTLSVGAFPNPFNPTTTLTINLPARFAGEQVDIRFFNTLGQLVRHIELATSHPGQYQVQWNGSSDDGSQLASGAYFAVLQVKSQIKKLKLLCLH